MLFVCFFPQILSGPISTGKDLLPQIRSERKFDYLKVVQGLRWLLWGMFLKVVVADRLAIYVNNVLDNYQSNSGVSCLIANILYTFQIYGDFAGYSLMAIGVARLMGFDLVNNFNRPYFAASITESTLKSRRAINLKLLLVICDKNLCVLLSLAHFFESKISHSLFFAYGV